MAALTSYLAAASLAFTAVSTIKAGKAAKQQNQAEQKTLRAQQRADDIRQARERRSAIREARIKQAQITQAGANQGATSTSAVQGGAGSVTSQLSGSLSFLDAVGSQSKAGTAASIEASRFGAKAQKYGQLAQLGGTIFSATSGSLIDDLAQAKQRFKETGSIFSS